MLPYSWDKDILGALWNLRVERNLDLVQSERATNYNKAIHASLILQTAAVSAEGNQVQFFFLKETGWIKKNFLEMVSLKHNFIGYKGYILLRR